MFCSQCGNKIPEEAIFCPACGGKVETDNQISGTLSPDQSNWQHGTGLNLPQSPPPQENTVLPQKEWEHNIQPVSRPDMQPLVDKSRIYPTMQKPDHSKNKKVLLLIVLIVAVLVISAVAATFFFFKQRDKDNLKLSSETTTLETTTVSTSDQGAITETKEPTTTKAATTETSKDPQEQTETTEKKNEIGNEDSVLTILPDSVLLALNKSADIDDYIGDYAGTIVIRVLDIEQIPAFQTEAFSDSISNFLLGDGIEYETSMQIGADYLDCYTDHPTSQSDGYFLSVYPLTIDQGTYFEEYSDDQFIEDEVSLDGFLQVAFYETDDGIKGVYIINYEEFVSEEITGIIEARLNYQMIS